MIIPFAKVGALKSDVISMLGETGETFTNSGEDGAADESRI